MREAIEHELILSVSMLRDHEVGNLVPRFDIFSPAGNITLFCPMPDDVEERWQRLNVVKSYMACKMITGFIYSVETTEPNTIAAIGVSRDEVLAAFSVIRYNPIGFCEPQWIAGRDSVGDEIPDLFPSRETTVSRKELAELERVMRTWQPGAAI